MLVNERLTVNGLGALCALAALLIPCGAARGAFRPPAVPLAVNDPQLSLWSAGDCLTDTNTMHWSRAAQPLAIVGEAGGRTWRFCGTEPKEVPAAKQLSVKVGCTETVYRFDAGGTPVELRFSTPLLPGEWDVFSRPVTYITVKGARAQATLSPAFATNNDTAEMVTNRTRVAGCAAISIARKVQPKPASGDRVRPNGGTAWLLDAGGHFLLAYDAQFDFSFLGKPVPAWWRRLKGPFGTTFRAMLEEAVADYPRLMRRMAAFDAEMRAQFVRAGGEKYADMAELAWRQSFGGGKLAVAANGDMLYFTKENTSNGCIATVDILYPQLPHLMLGGVELVKAAIRPDMLYATSGQWPYPYAPHDIGRFPFADGQRYGMGAKKPDALRMPVEECGNLILALYAVARMEGHSDFADNWWPTLCRWAAYLERFGFDPAEQLCTDDFAGHLARNANLSIKTIAAFEAFSRLAALRGDRATAARYHARATDGASKWVVEAAGGKDGATTLAFGKVGTWSLKYNLAFAQALGIDLFPADIARCEVSAYLKNADTFGIPLDNRTHWCKVDWLVWCATLAETRADFEAMVAPTWKFLNETRDRVAFPDLYYTENATCTRYGRGNDCFIGFNARPVIGGIFLPVARALKPGVAVRAKWTADPSWIRVAASDSRAEAKAAADLVCTGTNDEVTINRALRRCKDAHKDLSLFAGHYELHAVRTFGDGGPRAAIVIPNMKRAFRFTAEQPRTSVLRMRPSAFAGVPKGESIDAVRGEWYWRGIMNGSWLDLSNVSVHMPDPMRPSRAIDLRRVTSVEMRNVKLHAFGEAALRGLAYPYGQLEPPNAEAIGLTLIDGSGNVPANFVNVSATGFGQGIQVGGEHVVMVNCAATFGLYGFTFGNYAYHCGFNHPITLINCCDEQNVNLPLFASCGDNGGGIHGRQEVTMISFNCERVAAHVPGKKLGSLMRETRPGTWRGQIGYTQQPRWCDINSVNQPLWEEDGSGTGFRTINNAHRQAGTSAERRSYYPQYQQQYFDTDLNKLLICTDPKTRTWVDALGNRVE